jgi:transposase InsO family protein
VGGRARLGLPDGGDRLLHARDLRLAPGDPLPLPPGDRPDRARRHRTRHRPGTLTLGTDNGSAFTAKGFEAVLAGLGIAHRRGGYRDPESQAFIESWFGKLKQRCVWRHEFETLDQAGR